MCVCAHVCVMCCGSGTQLGNRSFNGIKNEVNRNAAGARQRRIWVSCCCCFCSHVCGHASVLKCAHTQRIFSSPLLGKSRLYASQCGAYVWVLCVSVCEVCEDCVKRCFVEPLMFYEHCYAAAVAVLFLFCLCYLFNVLLSVKKFWMHAADKKSTDKSILRQPLPLQTHTHQQKYVAHSYSYSKVCIWTGGWAQHLGGGFFCWRHYTHSSSNKSSCCARYFAANFFPGSSVCTTFYCRAQRRFVTDAAAALFWPNGRRA